MGKIYVGQTKLTMNATLGIDITNATPTLIKYIKHSGTTGSFVATITDAANGIITKSSWLTTDLDESGPWVLWGHITDSSGKVVAGEAWTEHIYNEGE